MQLGPMISKYDVKFTLPQNGLFPTTIVITNFEKLQKLLELKFEVGDTSPHPIGTGTIQIGAISRFVISYPGPFEAQLGIFTGSRVRVNQNDKASTMTCTKVLFEFGHTRVNLDLIKLRKLRIRQDSDDFTISEHSVTLSQHQIMLTDKGGYVTWLNFQTGQVSSDKKVFISSEYDITF